jgi:hypothetical protein
LNIAKLIKVVTDKFDFIEEVVFAPEKTKDLMNVGTMPLHEGFACKIGNSVVLLPFDSTVRPNYSTLQHR